MIDLDDYHFPGICDESGMFIQYTDGVVLGIGAESYAIVEGVHYRDWD